MANVFDDPLAELGIDTAASKSKKKDDDKVYINVDAIDSACDEFLAAKKQLKDSESRIERAEAKIIPVAEEIRLKESLRTGQALSTVVINDKVRVSVKSQYSNIDTDHLPELKAVLGDELNNCISVESTISLKKEIAEDKDAITKLITLLGDGDLATGKRKFAELFDVKKVYKVSEVFHNKFNTSKKFHDQASKLVEDKIIKRYKAAVLPK